MLAPRGDVKLGCSWLVLLGLLAGCSRPVPPDPDLLAKVGSREIRSAEFKDWMKRRSASDDPAQMRALLEEVIDHHSLVQAAEKAGLDKDPELRRSWENMLVGKLRQAQLESQFSNSAPTGPQVESYYNDNLASFTQPGARRGAVLFIETPPKMSAEQKSQARRRMEQARERALELAQKDPDLRGFGSLAVEFSEDQTTKYKGGDFGWIEEGRGDSRFDSAVPKALFDLSAPGAIGEILETPRGFYLLRLAELRAARAKPLEAAKNAIERKLTLENRRKTEESWKKQIRAATPVQIYTNALRAGLSSSVSPAPEAPPAVPR